MSEMEEFEAWARERQHGWGFVRGNFGGSDVYLTKQTQVAWEAWQARASRDGRGEVVIAVGTYLGDSVAGRLMDNGNAAVQFTHNAALVVHAYANPGDRLEVIVREVKS